MADVKQQDVDRESMVACGVAMVVSVVLILAIKYLVRVVVKAMRRF